MRSLDAPVDMRPLAVLRIALGPIVLLHLSPFLADSLHHEIYRDHFTLPFWDLYPHLPRSIYIAVLWVTAVAAVTMAAGLFTRWSAAIVTTGVAYNLFLSQTHFHHNRAFLLILLVGVTVLPTGRTVSVDSWLARRRGRPLARIGGTRLARGVLRIEIATVYAASGLSKLLDPDWWGGTVTRLRVEQHQDRLADVGIPDSLIGLLTEPGFHVIAAKVIVLTELVIGFGLLVRRVRPAALWLAIPFHVAIQFTAAVQVFSWAALAALVVWIDRPAHPASVEGPKGLLRLVGWLDWTGRFERRVESPRPAVLTNTRREEGLPAVLRRLPLTFWFAAPFALARRRRV